MINTKRRAILLKGYAGVTDVCIFVPCGHTKAKSIMNEIEIEVKEENKFCLKGKVKASRLLKYIGLTSSQVFNYADLEQKKDSAATESKL